MFNPNAQRPASDKSPIALSIVVLNYNGAAWLERCVESINRQGFPARTELIIADNCSSDGSADLAERLATATPRGSFYQHEENMGFAAGNNRAAEKARGTYLFFLNNDTWLEPDCLRELWHGVTQCGADAAMPLNLNYTEDTFQSAGGAGFDLCGLMSITPEHKARTGSVFIVGGSSFLIRREVFHRLGGFDSRFFMYAEEIDLSWRLWIGGYKCMVVSQARLHHRDAATAAAQNRRTPFELNLRRRFLTNRNNLFVLLRNAQHVLLLLAGVQVAVLCLEMLIWLLVYRDPKTTRAVYIDAFADCWRSRHELLKDRRRIARLRRRSDWWMLRFFRLRPNRWDEFLRLVRFGKPAIAPVQHLKASTKTVR